MREILLTMLASYPMLSLFLIGMILLFVFLAIAKLVDGV